MDAFSAWLKEKRETIKERLDEIDATDVYPVNEYIALVNSYLLLARVENKFNEFLDRNERLEFHCPSCGSGWFRTPNPSTNMETVQCKLCLRKSPREGNFKREVVIRRG